MSAANLRCYATFLKSYYVKEDSGPGAFVWWTQWLTRVQVKLNSLQITSHPVLIRADPQQRMRKRGGEAELKQTLSLTAWECGEAGVIELGMSEL